MCARKKKHAVHSRESSTGDWRGQRWGVRSGVGEGTVDIEMWQVSYSPVGEGVKQIFIYIILLPL